MIVLGIVILAGCAGQQTQSDQSGIVGTIVPDSKFAKLELGMSVAKITDLIGIWTDQDVYHTGKGWIPFYYGRDTVRRDLLYKNEGRLVIGGNGRLIKITVDPAEDGYK